jgi:hypothetical protein
MKPVTAFVAGIFGAAVMTILREIGRAMREMEVSMEILLGTMLGLQPGVAAWIFGFAMHLVAGGVFALIYAFGFEALKRGGVLTGVVFGAVHAVLAGLILGVMPMLHPQMPGAVDPPGIFLAHYGWMGVAGFVVPHFIFGAVVGGMYGRAAAETPPPVA